MLSGDPVAVRGSVIVVAVSLLWSLLESPVVCSLELLVIVNDPCCRWVPLVTFPLVVAVGTFGFLPVHFCISSPFAPVLTLTPLSSVIVRLLTLLCFTVVIEGLVGCGFSTGEIIVFIEGD
jgi:hypothetical protein